MSSSDNIISNSNDIYGDTAFEVPLHPYVRVFDLYSHTRFTLHVSQIKKYVYDPSIKDKLILPGDISNFIDLLTEGAGDLEGDDIIKGKSGGVISLFTGGPGVGKTMTAEVYSEVMGTPLYKVQSTQLGINVDRVEANLEKVLERARRWKCILLIDECDVYLRSRGDDLVQNAIVGVFLRTLEYYDGIIFLTSNLGTQIDEAIISRCIAVIEYKTPTEPDQKQILRIIAENYGLTISDQFVDQFVDHFRKYVISGRDIKSLIRLAGMIASKRGDDLTIEDIRYVTQFHSGSLKEKELKTLRS
jgi:SpoVK/Ycf46/Vps4 family AAA+-type ATPase